VFRGNICLFINHEMKKMKKESKNKLLPVLCVCVIIKPDAHPFMDVLMVCNPPSLSSPLILLSYPHSRTHHGFAQVCDGVRCQLVSPTCRRGSLRRHLLGVKLAISLSTVNFACPPPPHTRTHTHRHRYAALTCDLYGMAERARGVIQIIPPAWTGY